MNIKDLIFSNIYKNIPAFGLDISDFSIKVAQLEKKRKGFSLRSFNRFSLPAGVIEKGEIKDEKRLIEMLKKAVSGVKGEKIKTKYAVCSLPEQHAFVKVINFPKMKIGEIREAVKWEAEANIPFSLDEVYLGWQIVSSHQHKDGDIDVLISAAPKKIVDSYLGILRASGIEPMVFEVESVATARSLIRGGFNSKPVLILDLGFNRTSFIIFSGNSVCFTSSASTISNLKMLEGIAEEIGIDLKKAQSLKIKIGLGKTAEERNIFNALLPSLNKLIEKIKDYTVFYKEQLDKERHCKEDINEIILCGGGANLKGLPEYLSSRLKISVTLGNPWVNIISSKGGKFDLNKIPLIPYDESISYSTVLGLALRGMDLR